ncbi:hypothetical protein MHBO_003054 [Bonamia ostreae]|uniref:Uncharacterized protein n=1 Tax=Bonamia ostreae TaxID=126728 RepID=A0ABV2APD0_9EUKA
MKSKDAEMSMASAKILVEYVKFSPDIDIVKFYENLLKQNMSIKSALLFLENCLNFLDEKSDLIKSDLITLFWKFNEIDFKANFSAQLYDFVDFVLILIKNCNNDKTLFFKILNCFQFNGNGSTVSETKNYRILLCAIIKLFIVISAKCPNENYSEFYKLFLFQSNKLENKNINFGLFCENSRCEFYNVLYVTAVIKAIFLHKNRRKWLRIAESHLSESFGSQFDIAKILMVILANFRATTKCYRPR